MGILGGAMLALGVFLPWYGTDPSNPNAKLGALELSIDKDWMRLRTAAFFATGDDDARDDKGTGFDSIYDGSTLLRTVTIS